MSLAASTPAQASFNVTVNAVLSNGTLGSSNFQNVISGALNFASLGGGANQINQAYIAQRSVTAGTPDVLDLTGTSLKQPDGVTPATFADFVVLVIRNDAAPGGGNLQVGGGTNDVASLLGTAGIEAIMPGVTLSVMCSLASGYALNSSTAHNLNINSSAGTVPYSIAVLGH